MKISVLVAAALLGLCYPASAQNILFDFDNLAAHSGLPISDTQSGVTATFTATGAGYSIQAANTLGFTPTGFAGNCIYPDSVFASDLQIQFNQPLSDFSIMYAPEEYACDSSATLRVTAFYNGTQVGTATTTAPQPGTWPTGTLRFSSSRSFNYVVVHYDSPPPTGGDWGPIFMADNMRVSIQTAPQAVNDVYRTSVNTTLTVPDSGGVMANDQLASGATVAVVGMPTHGQLSLDSKGGFIYTPDTNFVGTDAFYYEDILNGVVSNHAIVYVVVQPILTGVTAAPAQVLGGANSLGTVSVSIAAPSTGTVVALASNSASVITPAGVNVLSGATSAYFTIKTTVVSSATIATITASLNGIKRTAVVTVYPLSPLVSLVASPTTVVGGTYPLGSATVSPAVPTGSETITLTSGSSLVKVPASVTIVAGRTFANFTVLTSPVSATTTASFSATFAGVKKTETITITVAPISKFYATPATVVGKTTTYCVVQLGGKAGPNGDVVTLTNPNPGVLTVPATVTVPASSTGVSFAVPTKAVTANTSVTLTATLGTSSAQTTITVTP